MKYWILVALVLTACAGNSAAKRFHTLDAELKPLIGQPKAAILLKYGAPTKMTTQDSVDVWQYHFSYGYRTSQAKNLVTGEFLGAARQWETYDDISFFFVNDSLARYKTYVQR